MSLDIIHMENIDSRWTNRNCFLKIRIWIEILKWMVHNHPCCHSRWICRINSDLKLETLTLQWRISPSRLIMTLRNVFINKEASIQFFIAEWIMCKLLKIISQGRYSPSKTVLIRSLNNLFSKPYLNVYLHNYPPLNYIHNAWEIFTRTVLKEVYNKYYENYLILL